MDSLVPNPQLKNRIFGAILLVILAVLLIPLFLGEPRSTIETVEQVKKAEFQSKIQPLPDTEDSVESGVFESEQSQADDANTDTVNANSENATGLVLKTIGSPESVTPKEPEQTVAAVQPSTDNTVVEEPKVEVVKKEAPKAAEKTEDIKEGWALQAGIFSKKENAASIVQILKKHDFNPNSNQTQASFGEATRVWLGPFKNKEQAQKVSAKLESIIGSGGYIAPYPFK